MIYEQRKRNRTRMAYKSRSRQMDIVFLTFVRQLISQIVLSISIVDVQYHISYRCTTLVIHNCKGYTAFILIIKYQHIPCIVQYILAAYLFYI